MTKRTTAEMRQIDVRRLADEGILSPGWRGHWRWKHDGEQVASVGMICESRDKLRLVYTSSSRSSWRDDETDHDYPVLLEYTEPHFGGERPWLLCPAKGCGRRCAILYGGAVFACRECHDLAYPRENMSGSRSQVARHRLRKLADKLDADELSVGMYSFPRTPARPKGMHESTYRELLEEFREAWDEHRHAMMADLVKVAEAAGADLGLTDVQRAALEE